VPTYEGTLNVEELVAWVSPMDKYFNYQQVNEENRVKLICYNDNDRKWIPLVDGVQAKRQNKGNENITN
jgi:hypothetical protein